MHIVCNQIDHDLAVPLYDNAVHPLVNADSEVNGL